MDYIAEILGVKVIRSKWGEEKKLPFYLTNEYRFEIIKIEGVNV